MNLSLTEVNPVVSLEAVQF